MKTSIFLVCTLIAPAAHAQFMQQGSKLVGFGAVGSANQGISVAVSSDGNTAILGGYNDNAGRGAAWVFVRDGDGVWMQQGQKLVGTPAIGNITNQGFSVGLSGDGNTAIIGSPADAGIGAAWVFTRTDTTWTQQAKLVGTGGGGSMGISVAISADGNTALAGGYFDASGTGAVWVFVRDTNNVWMQQGQKLVGSDAVGFAQQGISVSSSADGNTAAWGGWWDNAQAGAAWVFTRTGGTWSQQGPKLVGTGAVGSGVFQGNSVSLSDDGNTLAVGGYADNAQAGAVWIFTRGGGVWSQQGQKLVGTGGVGGGRQGQAVSLSSDGNVLLESATYDNVFLGSAWLFTRAGGAWSQLGQKFSGTGAVGQAQQGWSAALSGDAGTALIGGWRDNASTGAIWVFVRGGATISRTNLNKPIEDNQTTMDTIEVATNSPLAVSVEDVKVHIDTIMHPNVSDLEISLLHLGVTDTIVYQVGGSGDNFIGTVLDDSASTPIENGSAPFTGMFRPTRPLSQFDSFDAGGKWVISIFDRATGSTGTLQAWGLSLILSTIPTSVTPVSSEVPRGFRLEQNYPNPFNPSTKIAYQVDRRELVVLSIYDVAGREIATLVNETKDPGTYEIIWDATGQASGVYFYRLNAGSFTETRKLVLIR